MAAALVLPITAGLALAPQALETVDRFAPFITRFLRKLGLPIPESAAAPPPNNVLENNKFAPADGAGGGSGAPTQVEVRNEVVRVQLQREQEMNNLLTATLKATQERALSQQRNTIIIGSVIGVTALVFFLFNQRRRRQIQ